MAQIYPDEPFNDLLMERVVQYLQTRDPRLFPFTARFSGHQQAAFVRDLREALSSITDSGSARKSSATGFTTSDEVLRRVVAEWAAAGGGWPAGSYPQDPVTALGSSTRVDSPPRRAYPKRVIREVARARE
ncbi:MAG: hypothetical protein K0S78_946 [Thermomicrobiales bacterium]|nr:hypothetical protein [Thermomicrobiales bacterium]MDF3037619.1 hypothetical protein [Thermomicrobiales bacterium]